MSIIADLNLVFPHGHHAFDVELVLRQALDAPGLEDNNFAALRRAEVVTQPIHEEMIAGPDFHFYNIFALSERLSQMDAGSILQANRSIIRGEQDRVRFFAHYHGLPQIKNEQACWGVDRFQFAVALSHQMDIGDSLEPLSDALHARGDQQGIPPGVHGRVAPGEIRHGSHSEECGLH